MDLHALTRRYLGALELGDWAMLEPLYWPEVVQEELPNRLSPHGAKRDLAAIRQAGERGKAALREQTYRLDSIVTGGDRVAVEVTWRGVLARPIGSLGVGDTLTARFAMFLTFRDGRIVAQRNYDCFEAF